MSSRSYPDKIIFQQRTITTAASGQPVESWADVFDRWGKVEQISAGEVVANDQRQKNETYKITLPFDAAAAAVTAAEWRLNWRDALGNNHTLDLTGVNPAHSGRTPKIHLTAAG